MHDILPDEHELTQSQIPAITLLQKLGYTYLPVAEAMRQRGGPAGVLLTDILLEQLNRLNTVERGGIQQPFDEPTLFKAIERLRGVGVGQGPQKAAEDVHDLLRLGESFPVTIDGDKKSHSIRYIDWDHPDQNVYHIAAEQEVTRVTALDSYRPDLILYVNGIPFAVMECKARHVDVEKAIHDHLKKWRHNGILELYKFCQIAVATNAKEARFSTAYASEEYWTSWKLGAADRRPDEVRARLESLVKQRLTTEQKNAVFFDAGLVKTKEQSRILSEFEAREEGKTPREVTEQDELLFELLRPERLIRLTRRYILFDAGTKKIARYQQFRAVERTLERVRVLERDGSRAGGVVYHTQGSGKSLSMVMIARAILDDPAILNAKIILVTDRKDLDRQLSDTFKKSGVDGVVRVKSGGELLDVLRDRKKSVVSTLIHKFHSVLEKVNAEVSSPNIFVLVDESHRTQYGALHQKMRHLFPKACYIAFTGTPLTKSDKQRVSSALKDTFHKFGELIDSYPIRQAVADKAVVPLLYDGNMVDMEVNEKLIDQWFERICAGLTEAEQADLKRKYSREDMVSKVVTRTALIAADVHRHFSEHWLQPVEMDPGSGERVQFKGQVVLKGKEVAIEFKQQLDLINKRIPDPDQWVTSEVIISGPSEAGPEDDPMGDGAKAKVEEFWAKMMAEYKSEENYNNTIIDHFKHGDRPHLLIVVDKLITGFDAPRNVVMYLAKKLKEHTLLQAIARVNRLHRGKSFGFIVDYSANLGNLDHALAHYEALADFDPADLQDAVRKADDGTESLPSRHAALLSTMAGAPNRNDMASLEEWLGDKPRREAFYEALADFSKALHLAQSSNSYNLRVPLDTQKMYVEDLRRFQKLRASLAIRHQEKVSFREYEPQIQQLLHKYVDATDIRKLTAAPVEVFVPGELERALEEVGEPAAKADLIASAVKRTIEVDLKKQDPILYERFSKMINDTIEEYRQKYLSAVEYLEKMKAVSDKVRVRRDEVLPAGVQERPNTHAIFRQIRKWAEKLETKTDEVSLSSLTLAVDQVLERHHVVEWAQKRDVIVQIERGLDDVFSDFFESFGLEPDFDSIDECVRELLSIAKASRP